MKTWAELRKDPEYIAYAKRCVDACCQVMGEDMRDAFESCGWETAFLGKIDPKIVAEDEMDAL